MPLTFFVRERICFVARRLNGFNDEAMRRAVESWNKGDFTKEGSGEKDDLYISS